MYNLTINDNELIKNKGAQGENWDTLNSFWIGYRFSLQRGHITIEDGFLALYTSHSTNKPLQPFLPNQGPFLADNFGPLEDKGKVVLTGVAGKGTGNTLTMMGMEYMSTEDVECGNQAMQFHLLRFAGGSPVGELIGPPEWFNDSEWVSQYTAPDKAKDGSPMWQRFVNYGDTQGQYAHVAWRRRNDAGLRFLALNMPLQQQSLFSSILQNHNEEFPLLEVTATGTHGEAHWTEKIEQTEITKGDEQSRGVCMISHGAFSDMLFTEALASDWFDLIQAREQEKLCRRLLKEASIGSSHPHSFRQLSDSGTDSVVTPPRDHPHVFFSLWI